MPKKRKPPTSVVVLTPAKKRRDAEKAEFYRRQRAMGFPVPGDVAKSRPTPLTTIPVKAQKDAQGRTLSPASALGLLTGPKGTGKTSPHVVPKAKVPKPKPAPSRPIGNVNEGSARGSSAGQGAAAAVASPATPRASASGAARAVTTARGMSQSQMTAQAAKLVAQILSPQISSTNAQYANQGASENAAYQAAATMQQGVAPAIEQAYGAASSREAVIAKGLQVGAQLAGAQTAGDANATLAQNNSPQTVTAANIGAPLATLGGMSAQNLTQQGAAFGAAARFLPGQSRSLGIDAIKMAGQKGNEAVAALNARRPELVQGILGQLQDSSFKQQSLDQNNAVLAREGYIKETGMTPEGTMPFATRKWLADTFGVDPLTRLPTLEYQRAVTAEKQYAAKGKKGGFTASQIRNLKGDALVDARDAFDAETTYQDAILTMLAGGYPLVIAQNALNRFWKAPGALQAWEQVGKGRPKRSFQQRGGK